jgi:hypothetical protein
MSKHKRAEAGVPTALFFVNKNFKNAKGK